MLFHLISRAVFQASLCGLLGSVWAVGAADSPGNTSQERQGIRGGANDRAPQFVSEFHDSGDPQNASIVIRANEPAPFTIPRYITGKFAEHLGANIYNGMLAEILRNPTFADYPFSAGTSPDGVVVFQSDQARVAQELRGQARRLGWPEPQLDGLVAARADGLACWWTREGPRSTVEVSPDVGPYGGRGQRVEVRAAHQGIAQWTYLPLHRVRGYEIEILARAPGRVDLSAALIASGAEEPVVTVTLGQLSSEWRTLRATLQVPSDTPNDSIYRFALTADAPGQFVIAHAFLQPVDNVHGADPDVIRFLRDSHLPILRWPGGNFVSGYHWEEGIGPIEQRPTRPNYAWGGVEPNLFGTDEFIEFCRAVGCEPMICVNAGSGTPAEAARWIEYCNGPVSSPMGARRAASGHPEPYRIKYWEVGNELWGRWQYDWTTAAGYLDRYQQFVPAMLGADPTITLYACGTPTFWGKQWNETLVRGAGSRLLGTITDHPLIGGGVLSSVEPLDVFRDFMVVPNALESKWVTLRGDMRTWGIPRPQLAVTELQMFAHVQSDSHADGPARLTHETLVNPGTLGEALYDVLVYHAVVRLSPFVTMVTHSATVNHGGGLRKEQERVYANPCYYAQSAFSAFAEARPVLLTLEAGTERAPVVLGDLKGVAPVPPYGVLDALAARATDGSLLLSVVHRGTQGPVHLSIRLVGFNPKASAEVWRLSAEVPWAVNTLAAPRAVSPAETTTTMQNRELRLEVRPYTVMRIRFEPAGRGAGG